jgi:hypothetical protein
MTRGIPDPFTPRDPATVEVPDFIAAARKTPASEIPAMLRQFESGATRSPDQDRYDPEAFFSPIVIERVCQYMQKHQFQSDGTKRPGDNWQQGIPPAVYMKGMWRHFLHLWTRHRGFVPTDAKAGTDIEEDLCAIAFNVNGYLFEILRKKQALIGKSEGA